MADWDAAGGYPALWDWRRRVADLYGAVRAEPDPRRAWTLWRDARDRLFRDHPQSPLDLEARRRFAGLPCFDYDPELRFAVGIDPLDAPPVPADAGHDGTLSLLPFGRTRGLAAALGSELTLFWLAGYGGGVFLPFADATAGRDTYGGGRYLLDTIKGADLGADAGGRAVLDFNFSYNPSCSYSPAWTCPLSPPANRAEGRREGGGEGAAGGLNRRSLGVRRGMRCRVRHGSPPTARRSRAPPLAPPPR